MMTYVPTVRTGPTPPEQLTTDQLRAELLAVARDRAYWVEERTRRAELLARREEEHRARVANVTNLWGRSDLGLPAESQRAREARAALDEAERTVPAVEARYAALVAETRRRIEREGTAIAEQRRAIEDDERALGERRQRLRELTAPLIEFEGYGHADGILGLVGRTYQQAQALHGRRQVLAGREHALGRLRALLKAAD